MPPSRREELVDAAMKVFHKHGFRSTSLDRVLEESGVSRMTLYNHFASKDELILAALRRRDEIFRNRMMKFVEGRATTPVERVLAVFDYHEQWFSDRNFCGCMFINASAEFDNPQGPVRRVAADHKLEIQRYLAEQCEAAHLKDASTLAAQLNLLLEGAIVTAHVVGQSGRSGDTPGDAARRAKLMAQRLIDDSSTTS